MSLRRRSIPDRRRTPLFGQAEESSGGSGPEAAGPGGSGPESRPVERLFEAIANYTYDWESWMGEDGRPRWVNPAVDRMTGFAAAECFAMPDYPLPIVHGDDRDRMAAHLRSAAAGGSGNDVAFRIRRKDGTVRWGAISWQSLLDTDGRSLGYRTSVRDITQRKQAEDALREAHAEAERANRAKSRFLAAASHDLRQPLQAINMFVGALKSTATGSENEEIIAAIEDSLRVTNGLLDALLDVSRLDAGVLEPKPRDLAAGDLLDRMELEFAGPAAEKDIALRVVASSAFVRSDPILLDRMVRNLVSNAARYTHSGRILIGCRRRGAMLRLEVWDTGIGIPPDKLEAIFEEFYQIGNPERDRTRGLGLGLAIVDRMARLLGHRIDLRSEPDRGSMFAIELPLAAGGGPSPEEPAEAAAGRRLTGALLVAIDDEPAQLRAMREVFRRWGCEVVAADSADPALAELLKGDRTPDAIVADYRLRDGATGPEAILAIRAALDRAVPGIILTGDIEPARLQEVKAGGFALLHKPIDADRLRRALQDVVGQRAG